MTPILSTEYSGGEEHEQPGGFAAVAAIVVTFLLLAIGGSAMVMSQLGYSTVASENKYQVANAAAERAVNNGVANVISFQVCNLTATNVLANGATSFLLHHTRRDEQLLLCLRPGDLRGDEPGDGGQDDGRADRRIELGAMVLREGGTLLIGGSSSIASCDANCRGPAVVSGGPISGQYTTDTTCKNNNKGIVGDPAIQYTELGDLVPKFFNSDNFADLKSDIGGAYGVDVTGLTNTGIPGGASITGTRPAPPRRRRRSSAAPAGRPSRLISRGARRYLSVHRRVSASTTPSQTRP
ncbi:MAG: hypothetical protein MZV70_35820 [Desulfobacterales bacterium]|nr:hypothetical protein [Desulfobacterales bacterium]